MIAYVTPVGAKDLSGFTVPGLTKGRSTPPCALMPTPDAVYVPNLNPAPMQPPYT